MNKWICCQIGAREHYAIPRALYNNGQLEQLITDAWITPDSYLNRLPEFLLTKLKERYHPELGEADVKSFNHALFIWELAQMNQKVWGWDKIIARNHWWQERVLKILEKRDLPKNTTLFAYSYAALELFKYAKSKGWKTVLGQIDPGIIEQKLITRELNKYSLQSNLPAIPLEYWSNWREECALADTIMVNSNWSSQALQQTGVSNNKIKTIPLAYQPSEAAREFKRNYPANFSDQRPLKVLFLGQITIRKGIAAIFEAIQLLSGKPIEFWFVGNVEIDIPKNFKNHPQIKWFGSVARSETDYYYQQADILLFPTISDGFGLTQLEAQAWKLPLVTSQCCGEVVKDRINGLILPNVTDKAIAQALTYCLYNPEQLTEFSQASTQILSDFSLIKLSQRLGSIEINKAPEININNLNNNLHSNIVRSY